jgi:hypothetical protein
LPAGKLPSPQQIEDFMKLDDFYIWELLKKNGKNSHIDNSKSAWYKMNEEKGDNKEIMIIDAQKSHAKPLSAYSRIAKNIGTINQLRIYVRLQDKEKAEEIIS